MIGFTFVCFSIVNTFQYVLIIGKKSKKNFFLSRHIEIGLL